MPEIIQKAFHRSWLRPGPLRQAFSLLLCLLAACQPGLTPSALPTPHILAVEVTPALQSFNAQFHTCAEELPSAGLVINATPAASIDLAQAAIGLRWGAPPIPAGYAAVLGHEALAVMVSKQNPLKSISLADLQSIYQGKQRAWPETGRDIQAWTYPDGDDAALVFETAVLKGSAIPGSLVYTAPDPQAMLEAVSKDPGAIGYLPARWLDGSVTRLDINGIDPASLRQPVLALSKSEPEGPEKSWLLCLQQSFTE